MFQDHQLTILTSAQDLVPAIVLSRTTVASRCVEVESFDHPDVGIWRTSGEWEGLASETCGRSSPLRNLHGNELTMGLPSWCELSGRDLDQSLMDLPALSCTADRGQYR